MIALSEEEKAWAVADALTGVDLTVPITFGTDADKLDQTRLYFVPFLAVSYLGDMAALGELCRQAGVEYRHVHSSSRGLGVAVRICHAHRLIDHLNARRP